MNQIKIISALALLTLISIPVVAETCNIGYGTEPVEIALQPNQEMAYVIPLEVGDRLIVELEVASGGPVDFFLTNNTAYVVYVASRTDGAGIDSLYYIEDYSRKEAGTISYTYNSLVANELVVLIDNTGYTVDGAEPTGPVSVEGSIIVQKNVWTPQNIFITIIVLIIIIAVMVGIRYPGRRGQG